MAIQSKDIRTVRSSAFSSIITNCTTQKETKIKQQCSTCGVHDAEHAAGEAGTQERTIGRPGHIEGVTCALDLTQAVTLSKRRKQ